MSSSGLGLVLSLAALGVYGFSVYYMNSDYIRKGMAGVAPPELNVYGLIKFLTYQCLLIQLFSALLHVLGHFIKPLRGLRDLVFTTLAYPVGSIVVYTFWGVWFALGRESIFPERLDTFYPVWLNHATHTFIAPVNLLLSLLIHHKYSSNGALLTLGYSLLYTVFLYVIKAQTGLFVYGYLNDMTDNARLVYFAGTGVFDYLIYKSGQLLTYAIHGSYKSADQQHKPPSKKQKQK